MSIDPLLAPLGPSLHPRPSYQRPNEPRMTFPKRITFAAARRVRGYATALLCNARPVASELALIRSRVKRIRHKRPTRPSGSPQSNPDRST